MNQARIWLVVQPTVGLPLLLGTVTGIAVLVHYSVLSHTTWFADYWQGGKKAKAAADASAAQQVGELVLPNGTKVKVSFENVTPRQLVASALPERSIADAAVENSSPLSDAVSANTASTTAK